MIKCAVVGVGYLGRFHAEKYRDAENAELVAIVDVNEERGAKLASELGCAYLSDYQDLVKLGVECASVVSDTSTHYAISKFLLENGVDVLVEKPITTTVEEARDLISTAKARGRILQVGHLERFNPGFRAMQKLLTRPRFFEARRIAQFSGRGHDVDVVRDLMIHDIDIISHLVGRPLVSVDAVGIPVLTNSFDIANARLNFEGGAVANVTASRAAFKSERTIRIFQPNIYIALDFGAKKLKMYTKLNEQDEKGFPKIEISEYPVEERDALRDEISSFLGCVRNRLEPVVKGEDGLRALELAQQIYSSVVSRLEQSEEAFVAPEMMELLREKDQQLAKR